MRPNRLAVWWLVGALAGMGAFGHAAHAQMADIPDATRQNLGTLSDAERQAVKGYVTEYAKNLLSDDPLLVRRDREALLRKLEGGNISVSFRLAYAQELDAILTQMLASTNERTVINGLVLAGELATDKTLAMVQSKTTGAPAIRFEAACSLGRIFRAVQNNQPAINQISVPISGLEALIIAEKDAHVRDALVKAGLAATEIPAEKTNAISAIARGIASVVRTMNGRVPDDAELTALLRAGVGLRDVAARSVQQGASIAGTAPKDMTELGGVLLSAVSKAVSAAAQPNALAARPAMVQLAASAQTTIELAGQLLTGSQYSLGVDILGTGGQAGLKDATRAGDAKFIEDVRGITGSGGKLTRPPFELPAERFR